MPFGGKRILRGSALQLKPRQFEPGCQILSPQPTCRGERQSLPAAAAWPWTTAASYSGGSMTAELGLLVIFSMPVYKSTSIAQIQRSYTTQPCESYSSES